MIIDKLIERMKVCMKEKRKIELKVLRMAISALKNERIRLGKDLTEADEIAVLKKELKTYTDPLDEIAKKKMEISKEWKAELEESISVVKEYLPEEMPVEEVENIIKNILLKNDVKLISEKGKAMKLIMPVLKGKVDGKVINEVVSTLLK